MQRRRIGLLVALALATSMIAPSAHAAAGPRPGSPAWIVRALANRVGAEGRGIDQLANPVYLARLAPELARYLASGQAPAAESRVNADPFRLGWTRGRTRQIDFRNRYGARIHANLWAPPASAGNGPFPAVVIIDGYGNYETNYWWAAQGLAEAGYVVLTYDQQGQGLSDVDPNPKSVYCNRNGAWREPQEMGLRETGRCAGGYDNAPGEKVLQYLLFGVSWADLKKAYDAFSARFVFGALDATAWLLSPANPWQAMVDADRLGIAGHSAGAHAALLAANGDPLHRYKAAVTWDGYGTMPPQVAPTVPTMFQVSEQENLMGPYIGAPPRVPPGWVSNERRFAMSGVDHARIALRSSTHQEWTTPAYQVVNPFCTPFCNASRDGQIVAMHQTLAWFDRYVKADASAAARLQARTFDQSADIHSIGQGRFDPLTFRNVPYTIAGERVADHLSFYFRSYVATADFTCADLRRGCG